MSLKYFSNLNIHGATNVHTYTHIHTHYGTNVNTDIPIGSTLSMIENDTGLVVHGVSYTTT